MSHQTTAPRVPAGVATGGQFAATARGESPVELDAEARADRQARIATAMREATAVAESYGAADLRGVQMRAAFAVSLTEYVQDVRAAQADPAWEDGDVDTTELLDRGVQLLAQTDAHAGFVDHVIRTRYSEEFLDGDGDPGALVDDVATRVERHLALADAVLHSPFAGSERLARSRFELTATGEPSIVLDHTEFVAATGRREPVVVTRTPAGTVELTAAGQPVVGLGEHVTWSTLASGAGPQRSGPAAVAALAGIIGQLG